MESDHKLKKLYAHAHVSEKLLRYTWHRPNPYTPIYQEHRKASFNANYYHHFKFFVQLS
jgi:hypothetical protein